MIRRIGLFVAKDLLRRVRAPLGILFVLAFPVIFSLMLALAFGGGGNAVPKVRLLVEDHDDSFVSRLLVSAAGRGQAAEIFEIVPVENDGAELMERGEAAALLVIPEKFSSDLLGRRPVTLRLVRNPARSITPEIAEQSLHVLADVLNAGVNVLGGSLSKFSPCVEEDQDCKVTEADVLAVSSRIYRALESSERFVFPPAIQLEVVQKTEDGSGEVPGGGGMPSVFLLILPGVSVWALFMLGDVAMRDLLDEARTGTLRRQMAGPVYAGEVVAAKACYTAALACISLIILSTIGWFVAERGIAPLAFVVLSFAMILCITGVASTIYGIARTERQGATFASVLYLVFAFVGGSFVPTTSLPAAVLRFSPISPFYWATQGYRKLMESGVGIDAITTHIAVLAVIGAVCLALGCRLVDRRVRTGLAV